MKNYKIITVIFLIVSVYVFAYTQEHKIQSTQMHEMIKNGANADEIRAMLVKNYAVDARDEQNRTPLHLAALYANPEVIQVLCGQRADVTAKDFQGNTPLHLAVKYNVNFNKRLKAIDELLLWDANIYVKNNAMYSPIEDAIEFQYKQMMFKFVEERAE